LAIKLIYNQGPIELAKTVNLPILHLRTTNLNKEVIRREIEQKLAQ